MSSKLSIIRCTKKEKRNTLIKYLVFVTDNVYIGGVYFAHEAIHAVTVDFVFNKYLLCIYHYVWFVFVELVFMQW